MLVAVGQHAGRFLKGYNDKMRLGLGIEPHLWMEPKGKRGSVKCANRSAAEGRNLILVRV